jgi:cyclopropane fatty-acyl-phospholipid synthase-like methyltransferase
MPVNPNFLERTLFNTLNVVPGMMLDLAGMLAMQAVTTAVDLNIFPTLAKQPRTIAELAAQLQLEERGLLALMPALAALNYVAERNGRYHNSSLTNKWLIEHETFDAQALLHFWSKASHELLPHTSEIIRTGKRPFEFYAWTEADAELSDAYQRQLAMNAETAGASVVKKLLLPDAPTRLLDVGGGHGTYSILMCQKYPQLQATILDYFAGLETAQQKIAGQPYANRIHLLKGDMWEVAGGEGFDMILLFNVLHQYDIETNVKLLRKAKAALKPGGQVAILDQITGKIPGKAINAVLRLIALQYYVFADGRIFSREEMMEICQQAGFSGMQFHNLSSLPGNTLLTAVKS